MPKPRKKATQNPEDSRTATSATPSTPNEPERPTTDAPVASAPQSSGDTTTARPDPDRIARRAYELYLARGGSGGGPLDDWLEAEKEFGQGYEQGLSDRTDTDDTKTETPGKPRK